MHYVMPCVMFPCDNNSNCYFHAIFLSLTLVLFLLHPFTHLNRNIFKNIFLSPFADCQLTEPRKIGKWKHAAATALLPVATQLTFSGILLVLHLQRSVTHQNISKLSLNAWLANEVYSKGSVQTSKEQAHSFIILLYSK